MRELKAFQGGDGAHCGRIRMRKIRVFLSCTREMIEEEKVLFIDIAEDFDGADVLTFKCPKCKEEHTSRRFG